MDPLNNTTSNPMPVPTPASGPMPVSNSAPASNPMPSSNSTPTPTPGPAPVTPPTPVAIPAQPVNPVAMPTNPAGPQAPTAPQTSAMPGTMSMNQMFQSQPAQAGVFAETTAITAPEAPKAPDPIEEELKAPLKAAAPAPGSIGSAVSGPADGTPQNVAFNDLANNPMTANAAPAVKKNSIFDKLTAKTKMDKKSLIMLIAVAAVILVLLVVVLIMVMNGGI